jgi:hypothetical protein
LLVQQLARQRQQLLLLLVRRAGGGIGSRPQPMAALTVSESGSEWLLRAS